MQKFIIFFVVIGACGFLYFSYINLISKSLKSQPKREPSQTERILDEQRQRTESLTQDYRRVMEENRRTMEDNRRTMDSLRRQAQQR